MERPPEHESNHHVGGAHRYEVRRRRHRHGLRRKIARAAGWAILGVCGCVIFYYFLGWIADSTYVIDKLVK